MKHTPAEYAEILQSYLAEGKTLKMFKVDYDLRHIYVTGIMQRFKIADGANNQKVTEEQVNEWAKQYRAGYTLKDIAEASNLASSTVRDYLEAYEVHHRKKRRIRRIRRSQPVIDYRAINEARLEASFSHNADPVIYKRASTEAAAYWKDRSRRHYEYWNRQAQCI